MEILKPYRRKIDLIDDQIIDLLAERFEVIREVGDLKYNQNIPSILQDRVEEVRNRAVTRAKSKNVDPDLIYQIYTNLIDFSCNLEDEIKEELGSKKVNSI
jgi:chorismate mutase